jgi:hypothetical protein
LGTISVHFDQYYTYAELTACLKQYAEVYPQFVQLESVGKSHEGRDVWAVTLTNGATGKHEDKPGMYVDANIHAGEVTGSMASLYLLDYLVTNYGQNPQVTRLLDSRTFYILPRINPDGAELYLTTPTMLRSSVRPYPDFRKDEDPTGLHAEDINGDGRILLMRIRDDKRGAWKADREDPRLMVERRPLDAEGPFYHIYSEGVLRDHHGKLVERLEEPFEVVPTRYGLDLNRNFPAGYSPLTKGSGPFPLSEPETRNQVEFISKHKNIAGVLLYHTTGGILFRPHSTVPDKAFDKEDIRLFEAIGEFGTEATGYPVVCCYGEIFSGVLDDWCFEQLGLLAYTPELWNAQSRAAPEISPDPLKPRTREEKRQLELKLLQWNDRELAGAGFLPWTATEHPQFGTVEIGGWDIKEGRQNPPRNFLKGECHKLTLFAISYALALPEVAIDRVEVEKIDCDTYSVHAVVSNHGYLSTNITEQATKQKVLRPDLVRIELAEGMTLFNSEPQVEIGHLSGYSASQHNWFYHYSPPARSVARVKWNIKLAPGSEEKTVTVVLISQRGGKKQQAVSLSS